MAVGPAAWHDLRVILLIIGAVIVLLLLLLRVADRHDERHGHRPRRIGDIRSASRAQRRDLRTARAARYLPRTLQDDARRSRAPKKQQND